jgi:hypothetical protein
MGWLSMPIWLPRRRKLATVQSLWLREHLPSRPQLGGSCWRSSSFVARFRSCAHVGGLPGIRVKSQDHDRGGGWDTLSRLEPGLVA